MSRSNCIRNQMGAIIVKDLLAIATGYNGTPKGVKNCDEGGCLRCQKRAKGELARFEDEERCICVHAEQNAIVQAAYHGISTKGGTMYATVTPCLTCAKLIINAGIAMVICQDLHHDQEGIKLLEKAGVEVRKIK